MSRFHQARQGRGPRLPRGVRLSQYGLTPMSSSSFWSGPTTVQQRTTTNRYSSEAPPALLLIGTAIAYSAFFYPEVRTAQVATVAPILRMPSPAERISITLAHILDSLGDAIPRSLKLLYQMGQDVLRQERGEK
jgi:hypothetical protein